MRFLSDDVVAHLREIAEQPDLGGSRYELVRELGRGGAGVVYEVHDRELDRAVAMKVMDAEWRGEARGIARLEHPGIVPVHDTGVLPDGRIYYTMKLVRGERLDAWLAREHPLTEKLRLFARICEPVAFAHASGVVHRDLKPENVMAGEFGAVLVMDWGIDAVAGTPGFMAPEKERDARSDVYSLGKLLGFLTRDDKRPLSLAAIIAKASAENPEQRYANARAMSEDVLHFLDGEPVSAYRESLLERAGRWLTRNRALVAMVLAYLVMRAIVLIWMRR